MIKPLDPREFLNIQMQHVESGDYRVSSSPKQGHGGKVRRGGSLNRPRPPMDANQQHTSSLIKVLDSLPTSTPNPSSPVSGSLQQQSDLQ